MIVLLFITFFQIIFFKEFYEKEKVESLVSAVSSFGNDFTDDDWFNEAFYEASNDFMIHNNADIYYYQDYDDYDYTQADEPQNNYVLTFQGPDEHYDTLYIYDNDYNAAIVDQNLKVGQSLFLRGFADDKGSFQVTKINKVWLGDYDETDNWVDYGYTAFANYYTWVDIEIFDVSDYFKTFVEIPYSDEEVDDLSLSNEAYNYIDDNYFTNLGTPTVIDGVTYIITDYPYTNLKQVELEKTVYIDGAPYTLYASASLQSVDEVTTISQKYYPYFIGFSILLSIIISIIYSKMVSKPIVKLTKVADEMAKLNFEYKPLINRDDEIGQLSTSIYTLSTALENSMGNLRLSNQKLQQEYRRIAHQENKRKEFIANVSHELKTPLGVIRSFTEGIKDGIKKEKQGYYLDVILDESEKMDQMIIELLQLSKLDAGKIIVNKTTFILDELIKSAIDNLGRKFQSRNLTITYTNDANDIQSDYEKLDQVLLNLMDNASKYATEGTEVVIKTYTDYHHTYISLFNQCDPLSEDHINHIWDRFYKVDESHNRQYTGSGLGLSIVKSTVDAIEAWIEVKGTDDGIEFIIKI